MPRQRGRSSHEPMGGLRRERVRGGVVSIGVTPKSVADWGAQPVDVLAEVLSL